MPFRWPAGFERVPPDEWVAAPLDQLAVKYDSVEHHGWYANLDPSVEEVAAFLQTGDVLVDYSGGTGIFLDRLFGRAPGLAAGAVIADASPKFLRLALEKFRGEERVAFRWLRYLKEQKRLQTLDEVLGPALVRRQVEALVSTNAIHLYHDLPQTLASWHRCLKAGGRAFVQSGNIRPPTNFQGRWIIDDTVEAVVREGLRLAREDPAYRRYRATLDDPYAMTAHGHYRRKVFLPPRPLDAYAEAFYAAGFDLAGVRTVTIPVVVAEWAQFLGVYHDALFGWLGGSEKVEGKAPDEQALGDRRALLGQSLDRVFGGRASFEATWTYLTCAKRAPPR